MVFKRRNPRSYVQIVAESFYPRGGWRRASRYVGHRLRRLPDPAHKISRGIAAGVFVCFTPFFGFHFLISAAVAWMIRGNILAALLATFFGNPITFPIIAAISLDLGSRILGRPVAQMSELAQGFGNLWRGLLSFFTPYPVNWHQLGDFFERIFIPYLVGGLIPGLIAGTAAYFLSKPVIQTYKAARRKRIDAKIRKRRAQLAANRTEAPAQSKPIASDRDDVPAQAD